MYRLADVEMAPGLVWTCCSPADLAIHESDLCVVRKGQELEFGRVISLTVVEETMPSDQRTARILRRATLQDKSKADENALRGKMARKTCEEIAARMNVKISLVRVHYSFDRSRLLLLYRADEKIDTREVARAINKELRTHVDMQQIGVRDEAALLGGVGPCGRVLCCCSWLKKFSSINVKMAKTQGLSLNPMTISGNCGRLKCCLNFEYDVYRDLARGVPRQGARVETPAGEGCVIDAAILKQRVKVRLDEDGIQEWSVNEVRELHHRRSRKRRPRDEHPAD